MSALLRHWKRHSKKGILEFMIAEHLIEVGWAAKDADCQVDCDLSADWFTQEIIKNAPRTL